MATYEKEKTSRSEGTQSVVDSFMMLISPKVTSYNCQKNKVDHVTMIDHYFCN